MESFYIVVRRSMLGVGSKTLKDAQDVAEERFRVDSDCYLVFKAVMRCGPPRSEVEWEPLWDGPNDPEWVSRGVKR